MRLSGAGTTAASGQDGTTAQPSSSNSRATTLLSQARLRQETSAGNTPNPPRVSGASSTLAPNGAPVPRPEPQDCMAPPDVDPSKVMNSQDEEARIDVSGAHGSGQRIGQTSSFDLSTQAAKRKTASAVHTTRKRSKAINDVPRPSANSLTEVVNETQALPSPSLAVNIPPRLLPQSEEKQNILQGGSAVANLPKDSVPRPIPRTRTPVGLSLSKPFAVNRRFKPIVVHKRPPLPHSGYLEPQSSISKNDTALLYLDVDPTVILAPSLLPIGLPPKLSQRKKVTVYALIFSFVDPRSLRHCARASRVLRYAGIFDLCGRD